MDHDLFAILFEQRASAAAMPPVPILHISAHGSTDGIGFTNGEFLTWEELSQPIERINRFLAGRLFVCISSCHGIHGYRMAERIVGSPYWALVGHLGEAPVGDLAIGFTVFYKLLSKGQTISDAIGGMRLATLDNNSQIFDGDTAHTIYLTELLGPNVATSLKQALRSPDLTP